MSSEIEKKLEHLQILPEGGRAVYQYTKYAIIHMYAVRDARWPLHVGALGVSRDHLGKWFFAVPVENLFEKTYHRFLKNPKLLDELESFIMSHTRNSIKQLKQPLLQLSNQKLKLLISSYYNQYETVMRAAGVLRNIDRAIVPELRTFVSKEDFPFASISERLSFSLQEEIATLQLAIALKQKKLNKDGIKQKIAQLHGSFCWSVCGYYNEKPKTIEDYESHIRSLVADDPEKHLKALQARIIADLAKKKRLLASLDSKRRLIVSIASSSTYLKDFFKSSINAMSYHAEPLFREIAKRAKKTPEFIKDLLPSETMILLDGKRLDEHAIKKRVEESIFTSIDGQFTIISGSHVRSIETKYLVGKDGQKTEFKGRTACPGVKKGMVKIVLGSDDFHKMAKGDILVAVNTSPDFVPVMKKAAAIIAEEGGITAHVSVVSREMGIPSVVGIPFITTFLKDGDLVEVDATNGIVKILKRA